MNYVFALLVGLGGGFLAQSAGVALFAGVFELLWHARREALVDYDSAPDVARAICGLAGFAAAALVALRRSGAPLQRPIWQTVAFAAVGGAGCAALGYVAGENVGFQLGQWLGWGGKDHLILGFIVGSCIGMIVGILAVLWLDGRRRILALLGHAVLAVPVTLALLLVSIWCWASLGKTHYVYGINLVARFQIRFPPDATPRRDEVKVHLDAGRDHHDGFFYNDSLASDDRRALLTGGVWLYRRTNRRVLTVSIPGSPDRVFLLKLPADPVPGTAFGDWQPPDFIEDSGVRRAAKPDDGLEIRYYVEP